MSLVDHLLNTSLPWFRPTYSTDAGGGQQLEGYDELGSLRCMVSQPTAEEVQDAAARWDAVLTHVVYANPTDDVLRGDEFGGPIPSMADGERLRVLAIVRNSRTTYTRVQCETVQAEPSAASEGSSSS